MAIAIEPVDKCAQENLRETSIDIPQIDKDIFTDRSNIENTQPEAINPIQKPYRTENTISNENKISNDIFRDRIRTSYNPSGTTSAEFHMKPTFYKDKSGEQKFIDTTLVEISKSDMDYSSSDIDFFQFQCLKNNLKIYFKDNYKPELDGSIIEIRDNNNQNPLTWQPIKISISSDNKDFNKICDKIEINFHDSKGIFNKNKVNYKNIFPGCDDRYLVLPNELKHDFILNEFPEDIISTNSISEMIQKKGNKNSMTLNYYGILNIPTGIIPYMDNKAQYEKFETSKPIELCNIDTGESIYSINPPIAFEHGNHDEQIQCSYEIIPHILEKNIESSKNNQWSKTLMILKTNLKWLISPDRQYPIVIDPGITTPVYDKGEDGIDAFLMKGNETNPELSGNNYGGNRELFVSLAGPSLYSKENLFYRSIIKFPGISAIPSHAQVLDAKLILQCMGGDGDLSITVFKLFDEWLEGSGMLENPGTFGASWNSSGYNIWSGGNFDGFNTSTDTVKVSTPGYYQWDVTGIVKGWVINPTTNFGFLLSGTDNEDVIKLFRSSEAISAKVRPILEVDYNTPPISTGLETIIINEPKEGAVKDKTEINMASDPDIGVQGIFYDPDVKKGKDILEFEIWDGTYSSRNKPIFKENGVYSSKNITVDLRTDNKLHIIPSDTEIYGEDTILVRARDRTTYWLEVAVIVKVLTINDQPEIKSIGEQGVYDEQVELEAKEGEAIDFVIVVDDPDNPEFLESMIENTSHNAPADLDFRWEVEKTDKFTISQEEDKATITFNPENELVGLFFINITVYDNYWYKPTKYSKLRKVEMSNHTVMIKFTIENVNNPPGRIKLIEPYEFEFSVEEEIKFKAKCKDPDMLIPDTNEKLTFIWSSNVDGDLGAGEELKTMLSKGKHTVTIKVIDIEKMQSELSFNLTIRNRATISRANCTHYFTDDTDDVMFYYYSLSDQGDKEFYIERGSSFPEFDIFIDIIELTSIRDKSYLLINLTFREELSLHMDSKNYKYRFEIYLIKPGHEEVVKNLNKMEYDSRLLDTLYSPDQSKYFGKFNLNDAKLVSKNKRITIRKHLGDLENGEGINSNLLSDFSIFATVKVELKQHPLDSFEHVICFDSIGLGAKPAPNPKQKIDDKGTSSDKEGFNLGFVAIVIVVAIIIVFIIVIFVRKRRLEAKKLEEKTIYDTTRHGAGMPLHMQMPMHPIGPPGGSPFNIPPSPILPPPGVPRPGQGMPLLPLLPPAPPGQFSGPGPFQPPYMDTLKGKRKKKRGLFKK